MFNKLFIEYMKVDITVRVYRQVVSALIRMHLQASQLRLSGYGHDLFAYQEIQVNPSPDSLTAWPFSSHTEIYAPVTLTRDAVLVCRPDTVLQRERPITAAQTWT